MANSEGPVFLAGEKTVATAGTAEPLVPASHRSLFGQSSGGRRPGGKFRLGASYQGYQSRPGDSQPSQLLGRHLSNRSLPERINTIGARGQPNVGPGTPLFPFIT